MAPRGVKRTVQGAKAAPPAKAQNVEVLVDPKILAITEVVNNADNLPVNCKRMLVEMIPGSFLADAAARHEIQSLAVSMVGELVVEAEAKLHEAAKTEEAALATIEAEKSTLEGIVAEAEARFKSAVEATDGKKAALDDAETAARGREADLAAAKVAQTDGDAILNAIKNEKDSYEAVTEANLKPLSAEDLEPPQAQAHLDALLPLIRKIALDESLHTALPTACLRPRAARGAFDILILQELDKSLSAHIGSLSEAVETNTPLAQARAETVEAAQRALADAGDAREVAVAELNAARHAKKEASAALLAKVGELAELNPRCEGAKETRDGKSLALKQFQSLSVASFVELRDKAQKEPDCEAPLDLEAVPTKDVVADAVPTTGVEVPAVVEVAKDFLSGVAPMACVDVGGA